MPPTIAAVLSSGMGLASRCELDTVYGIEDLCDFLEIITVHRYNEALANKNED